MPPIIVALIAIPYPLALGAAILQGQAGGGTGYPGIAVMGAIVVVVVSTACALDGFSIRGLCDRVVRLSRRARNVVN